MFTGLVQGVATVKTVADHPNGRDLSLIFPSFQETAELGESIAIDGCCLTVTHIDSDRLTFQAGAETLAKTTLGSFGCGTQVNFERAMRLSDRLGGHLVSGHVDGVGKVLSRQDGGEWSDIFFELPENLLPFLAPKGSVSVNGVSLTVVQVVQKSFSVALIPHTLAATNLGQLQVGDAVNLETDMIAKYVQRLLDYKLPSA